MQKRHEQIVHVVLKICKWHSLPAQRGEGYHIPITLGWSMNTEQLGLVVAGALWLVNASDAKLRDASFATDTARGT